MKIEPARLQELEQNIRLHWPIVVTREELTELVMAYKLLTVLSDLIGPIREGLSAAFAVSRKKFSASNAWRSSTASALSNAKRLREKKL